MKKYVLGVKDDVAGDYTIFGEFPSISVGKRAFRMACERNNDIPVSDLSLYLLCVFDNMSGVVDSNDDELGNCPAFIERGEKE